MLAFIGYFFGIFFHHLILYSHTKEKSYLIFAFYSLALFTGILSIIDGMETVWGSSVDLIPLPFEILFIQSYQLSLLILTLDINKIKELSKLLYKNSIIIVVINIIGTFFLLEGLDGYLPASLFCLSSFIVSLFLTIYAIKKKNISSVKYFWTLFPLFFLSVLFALALNNFLPMVNDLSNVIIIGAIWNMSTLALLISGKIRDLKTQLEQTQLQSALDNKIRYLQARNISIGEMLADITHQWKQPLAATISIQNSLLAPLLFNQKISHTELRSSIESSIHLIQHLGETIDTFYRFLAQHHSENDEFKIIEQFNSIEKLTKYSFKNSGIDLRFHYESNPAIQGDSNEFLHALLNIILNSKDALENNDSTNPFIAVTLEEQSDRLVITVEDNAGGIKLEPIDSIFDRYISSKNFGSGLGLFMTKEIILKRFGGSVSATNTPFGAFFTIILPFNPTFETQDTLKEIKEDQIQKLARKILALEESEQELRQWADIFGQAHWGIAIKYHDSDRLHSVNSAFCNLYGYTIDEIQKLSCSDLFAYDGIRQSGTFQTKLFDEGYAISFSFQHRKDETVFPATIEAMVVKNMDSSPRYILINIWDKTEELKHINEIQMLGNALNSADEAIYMITSEGQFLYANKGACKMLGYSREEFLSMKLSDIDSNTTLINKIVNKEHNFIFESQHSSKKGRTIAVEISPNVFYKEDTPYIILTVHDITERKMQETTIIAREREFRTLTENSPDIIIRYDLTGKRIYVNPSAEYVFGCNASEIIGTKFFENSPIPDISDFKRAFNSVVLSKKSEELEHPYKMVDGNIGWMQNRIVPEFDKEGNLSTIIAIGHDISMLKEYEKTLLARELEFRTLAENSPDVIIRYDLTGKRIYVNPMAEKLSGFSADQLVGKRFNTNSPFQDLSNFYELFKHVITTKKSVDFEQEFVTFQGVKGWGHILVVPEFDPIGNIVSIIIIGRNITNRKRQEDILRQKEQYLKEAQSIAKVGNWIVTYPDMILEYSDEITKILEISLNNTLNEQEFYEILYKQIHPEERDLIRKQFENILSNQSPFDMEFRLLFTDKRIKYIHHRIETIYDIQGNPLRSIGIFQDITDQKIIEKKMEFLALHDPLIGLPNRIFAKKIGDEVIFKNASAALLYIDLDEFKTFNDTLGHSVGDTILTMVADRFKQLLQPEHILCRQGGDEFLIIISNIVSITEIENFVKTLLTKCEEPLLIDEHLLIISATIGISLYPKDGENFETLLRNADMAMYQAKHESKNSYQFYNHLLFQQQIEHFTLKNELKSALDNNEFLLAYQPQIDLATKRIIGVEALIRWKNPQKGILSPTHFISLAESTGLIIPIGEWVIREACFQAAYWKKRGIDTVVAVNISSVQFKDNSLKEIVKQSIENANILPNQLELELTESILIDDTEIILDTVRSIKALGVKLSIDDFGTGYSSLAYLKKFAVDKLKIDQSFIRDILVDQEDRIIVQTIIQMAHNLNLRTIAEGVENQETFSLLNSFGCDEIQGYFFSKPITSDDFESLFWSLENQ
jgi:diguanylate cyclase (GGDEF)-like protein/PAS domain S-box-containing protein